MTFNSTVTLKHLSLACGLQNATLDIDAMATEVVFVVNCFRSDHVTTALQVCAQTIKVSVALRASRVKVTSDSDRVRQRVTYNFYNITHCHASCTGEL